MVGDKLSTDILGASRTNIRSVWINRKQLELSGEVTPDYEISQLRDLLTVLENLKKE
jgi:putative hydrolase of the HAD superfamily